MVLNVVNLHMICKVENLIFIEKLTFIIKAAIKTVTSLSTYEKILGALSTIKKDCYAQLRFFVTRKQNFCYSDKQRFR